MSLKRSLDLFMEGVQDQARQELDSERKEILEVGKGCLKSCFKQAQNQKRQCEWADKVDDCGLVGISFVTCPNCHPDRHKKLQEWQAEWSRMMRGGASSSSQKQP